jgi:IPT/TIG domain
MNNPRRIQRHLVKALAAGALLAAAALPLAFATAASAAGPPVLTGFTTTPASIGAGGSGTVAFTGTGFADDGGAVSLASAAHITFTDVKETSSTTGTADISTTTAAAAGADNVTLTDDNGGPSNTLTGVLTINPDPTISSISPTGIWDGTGATTVTISGANFETGATVAIYNATTTAPLTATVTSVSSGSIVLSVTPTDSVNSAPAAAGNYDVVVTNPDGGYSAASIFTVGNGLENLSPSAVPATAGTYTVALLGSGFQYGATLSFTGTDNADVTVSSTTITSPTAGTATIVVGALTGTPLDLNAVVTNTGAGNNGDVFTLDNGLGVGQASEVAPLITASSATTPIVVGSAATTVTLTGSGFSQYSTVVNPGAPTAFTAANGAAGTTLTFNATVTTGADQGPVAVEVDNTAAATTFTPAITVAGPVITSQAPNLVVGEAFGSTVVLTGTGFTNTTTGTVVSGGGTFNGTVSYASATTMDLVVTASPNAVDATPATAPEVFLTQTTATGVVYSQDFTLTVDAAPLVTGPVTYATGAPSDVGVGATATTVYINGSGFETGATVTAFTNGAGVADPNVTATVTGVNTAGTQITATIAIKAPDTNTAVGYTVTNTDGGSVKVAAFAEPIFIGAGPTITSVTPVTGDAGATTTFALAGTGFAAGAVVTLSPANGTCGTPTISATTTLSVACTLGTAGVTPTYIVVTNLDGGSATSTTAVLGAEVVAKPFHVSAVHGAATAGKTVTVLISGTGFYGQPKVTATGYKFGVVKDSGTVLTVRVTAKKGLHGEHTLTVRLANGKSGKAGFNTKA